MAFIMENTTLATGRSPDEGSVELVLLPQGRESSSVLRQTSRDLVLFTEEWESVVKGRLRALRIPWELAMKRTIRRCSVAWSIRVFLIAFWREGHIVGRVYGLGVTLREIKRLVLPVGYGTQGLVLLAGSGTKANGLHWWVTRFLPHVPA